jgi:PhzF family phenazine biosynthesis protein
MRRFPYFQLDVFAPRVGSGNPLAVVLEAERLDAATMQAIAGWTNVVETCFVSRADSPGADYRVRIFTPQREIAFAGHPTLGTAHAVLEHACRLASEGTLMQQCQPGLLPIRIEHALGLRRLSVRVPLSRIVRHRQAGDLALDRALGGVPPGRMTPALVAGGRRWWLAELQDESSVRGFAADADAIRRLAAESDSLGLCVFARCPDRDYGLVVRAFPLGVGIVEDPASGAANAAIAAFLHEADALDELGTAYVVSQGREIGRDARLELRIDDEGEIWVGGQVQTVLRGEIAW